ncbi:MAG: biotin transporter BioY [Spirochaetaceae bacterium]|nr:biotin transporter BioY [Spirochaetaceae bacterium]
MKNSAPALAGQRKSLVTLTLAALFAALITAGTFIAIPLPGSPVPVVLQDMFALLAGLVLGPLLGAASVGIYLIAGALGAPVFAGASGGFTRFLGPTGGFLIGYLFMALLGGAILGRPKPDAPLPLWRLALGVIAGSLAVYGPGVLWLKIVLDDTVGGALLKGFVPFIPGTILKGIAGGIIAKRLRRIAADLLNA